jgi:hypothetical protein
MERDRKIGDGMKVVLLVDQGERFVGIAKFFSSTSRQPAGT